MIKNRRWWGLEGYGKEDKEFVSFLNERKKGRTRGSQKEEKLVKKSWCKHICGQLQRSGWLVWETDACQGRASLHPSDPGFVSSSRSPGPVTKEHTAVVRGWRCGCHRVLLMSPCRNDNSETWHQNAHTLATEIAVRNKPSFMPNPGILCFLPASMTLWQGNLLLASRRKISD